MTPIRNLATDQCTIARSLQGFSSECLLIGNFTEAEATLVKAVKELQKPGLFQTPPDFVLLHPLEIISGGINEVEDRVLRDLAASCSRSRHTPAAPQRYSPTRLSPALASPRSPRTRSAAARPASIAPSK